jgi:hypothetical protein
LLPRFVITCRELSQFSAFIKQKFAHYQQRRDYIWAEFAAILARLEGTLTAPEDESSEEKFQPGEPPDKPQFVTQRSDPIASRAKTQKPIRILFLAANPTDTPALRLDAEMRAINPALRNSEYRDRFDIKQQWAVRIIDIQGHLLRHKPEIVHFSGHGSSTNALILEDNAGRSHPVSVHALSSLFSALKDNIRCVVLNACYSEDQAAAISEHIDCVVGMSRKIGDSAAIAFASAFYQALGYGRDVRTAFDLGCAQIDLENLDEQDAPKLIAKRLDAKELVFV